jgi:hypothetical protein
MSNIMNTLFGPLGKVNCLYFYFLSILFFVIFIIILLNRVYKIIKQYKKLNSDFYITSIIILVYTLIPYYINRLMYSVCVNSLR